MNKKEVLQLAENNGALPMRGMNDRSFSFNCGISFDQDTLLAFANACEKIGIEKAANEALKTVTMEGYEKEIARDILALISSNP